jgi:superfamily II DNA or RNA helicase
MLNKKQITVGEANLLLKGIITKSIAQKIFQVGGEYHISQENLAKLMDKIRPWVFFAKQEECLDLPEQVDEVRSVVLPDKQRKHYKEMLKDLITEIGSSTITAEVAFTKAMKLREITSGFAIDVTGKEVDITSGDPAKIRELDALLDEIGGKQAIIWGCFRWDIRKVVAFLEKKFGPGCATTLYADTPDKNASIDAFRSGSARFLVANPQSAAHGLNLQFCSIQIFFSLDYSSERYWQAKARTHRSGQTEKCVYVHLVAHDTIDEDIMECLKNKGDMNQVAYRLLKK